MDTEPITASSLGRTYMINADTLEHAYKNVLSDYQDWELQGKAIECILRPENMGEELGIDETSLGDDVRIILHNKDGHGRKGTIVAIITGLNTENAISHLKDLPQDARKKVTSVTMDLSDTMSDIVKAVFPNAMIVRDCFHVVRRATEASEEIRMKCKREAGKELKRQMVEHKKHLEELSKKRTWYKKHIEAKRKEAGKPIHCKGRKRGRKPMRLNAKFIPPKLSNGETLTEALTRCRDQLRVSRNKWNPTQEACGKILVNRYPKLEESYNMTQSLRSVFRDKTLVRDTAKTKLENWYNKATECTLREVKSVRDTIKFYEEEILNYFIAWQTNASAESLNSKIKRFWAQLKGVKDVSFFFYRVVTIFG